MSINSRPSNLGTPKFSHFHLSEFFKNCTPQERNTALLNTDYLDNIIQLNGIVSLLRDMLCDLKQTDVPITITSCYRDYSHNLRAGGAKTSQHLTGSALDFQCKYLEDAFILLKNYFKFGQLIRYNTFIHVSLPTNKHLYHIIDKRT